MKIFKNKIENILIDIVEISVLNSGQKCIVIAK